MFDVEVALLVAAGLTRWVVMMKDSRESSVKSTVGACSSFLGEPTLLGLVCGYGRSKCAE